MDTKSWNVLVYATDSGLSAMCGQLVAMLGSEVEELHESTVALELAQKKAFDLIIVDWASLPEPRQEQLDHLLRANGNTTPRLLITCEESDIESAQSSTTAMILTKPVDPEVLRAAISESLSRLDQPITEPERERDSEIAADYKAAHPPFDEVAVNESLLNDDATATDRIKEPTVSKTGLPKSEASIIKALDELAGLANAAETPEDRTQPNAQLTDFEQIEIEGAEEEHTEGGATAQSDEPLAVPVAEDDSFDPFDDYAESELDQTQPDAILDLAGSSPPTGAEALSEPDDSEPEPAALEEPNINADETCEEEDLAPLLYALHEEERSEEADVIAAEPISEAVREQPALPVVDAPIATEPISKPASEQPALPVVDAPIATEPEAEKRPSWQPPENESLSHEFIMVGGVPSDAPPSPPPVIIDKGNQAREPEQRPTPPPRRTPSPIPLTAAETPPPTQHAGESGSGQVEAKPTTDSPDSQEEQALPAAGKLKALPLYQMLVTVLTEKVSGTLTLDRADKQVTFFFDNGRLIGFESEASEFEIIPWLLSQKLVDSAAGEEALLESFATGTDQLELVFRRQLLEPIQIDSAMSDHLGQICLNAIGWGRGSFTFKGGKPKPSGPPVSSPNIAKLIFEGMVAHASERHIIRCAELPDQAAALPKKDAPLDPKDIPVPPKIARVRELALGSVGMGNIVECGVLNRHQTLAVVRALKALNAIEIDSSGESAQPAPRKSCEPPRPSGTPLARITKPPPRVETPPPQSTESQPSATASSRSSRPAPAPSSRPSPAPAAQPSTASSSGPAQATPPGPSASPKPPMATEEAPKSGAQPSAAQRRKTVEDLMDREVDVKREMKAILTDYVEEQKKEKQRSGKKKGLLSRLLGDE